MRIKVKFIEDNSFDVRFAESSTQQVRLTDAIKGDRGEPGPKGKDGHTPIKGVDYFDGKDGKDGKDGYTPIKDVDYFDGYTPIKGVDYFDGKDGTNGKDGYTPVKGKDYFDGQDGYTPVKGKDYRDGVDGKTPVKGVDYRDGIDGKNGTDGKDGVSPVVSVSKTGKVATITIVDKMGTHTFTVNDGEDGSGQTYDDTEVKNRLSTIEGKESTWNGKQDAITDLATIRTGASKGATALQSYTETDPTVPSWAKQPKKPTYTADEVGALPNTTVIPTVPTNLSAFTDDVGYAKSSDLPTDSHINSLIDAKLGVIENGTY